MRTVSINGYTQFPALILNLGFGSMIHFKSRERTVSFSRRYGLFPSRAGLGFDTATPIMVDAGDAGGDH